MLSDSPTTTDIDDEIRRALFAFAYQRQLNLYYGLGLNILFLSVVLVRFITTRLRLRSRLPTLYTPHHHARPYPLFALRPLSSTLPTSLQLLAISITTLLLLLSSLFSYSSSVYLPNPLFLTTASQYLRYSANRTGVLSFAILPVLVLSAARKSVLVAATYWSHDAWNIFHRWLGRLALALALVHTVLYCAFIMERGEAFAPQWGLAYWQGGVVATVAMGWLAGPPSLRWVRGLGYEAFLWGHVVASLAVVYFCAVHVFWVLSVEWLWVAGVLWVVDRAVRVWLGVGGSAEGVAEARGEVVRLVVRVQGGMARCASPGQFVYLSFPQLRWAQSHPFSIADVRLVEESAETSPLLGDEEEEEEGKQRMLATDAPGALQLTFVIRPYQGVTRALQEWAVAGKGMLKVGVEGPYTHYIPLPEGPGSETIYLAGGVGIALVLPYLLFRVHGGSQSAHWAVGREEDLWALESALQGTKVGALVGLTVHVSFSAGEVGVLEGLGAKVVRGRLRIGEVLEGLRGDRRAVMACGPGGFLDECRGWVERLEGVEYWEEVSTR